MLTTLTEGSFRSTSDSLLEAARGGEGIKSVEKIAELEVVSRQMGKLLMEAAGDSPRVFSTGNSWCRHVSLLTKLRENSAWKAPHS